MKRDFFIASAIFVLMAIAGGVFALVMVDQYLDEDEHPAVADPRR